MQLIQPNVESFIVGRQSNNNKTYKPQNKVQPTMQHRHFIYLYLQREHKTFHYTQPLRSTIPYYHHHRIHVNGRAWCDNKIQSNYFICFGLCVSSFILCEQMIPFIHSFRSICVYGVYTYESPATSFNTDNRCVDGCDKRAAIFVFRTLSHNQLN